MATAYIMEFSGVRLDKYDAINKALGIVPGSTANMPSEIISHLSGESDSGFWVVDVWSSSAAFDRFFEQRLSPAMTSVQGLPKPRVVKFEVYNRFPPEALTPKAKPIVEARD
jgi:hypothetical protein